METLQSLDEATFKKIFDGVPQTTISKADFEVAGGILDILSSSTNNEIYSSKGEARRALQGNAISINKVKITDEKMPLADITLLNGKFILVGKGKKNHIVEVI